MVMGPIRALSSAVRVKVRLANAKSCKGCLRPFFLPRQKATRSDTSRHGTTKNDKVFY